MDYSLFVDPADINPTSPNWELNKRFGEFYSPSMPAPSPISNRYTSISLYSTSVAGTAYAVTSGTLKIGYFYPEMGAMPVVPSELSLFPIPERVSVILEVSPLKGMGSTWDADVNYLGDYLVTGFRYDEVDTQSLRTNILEKVKTSVLPSSGLSGLDDDTIFMLFLHGYLSVGLDRGDSIANAGSYLSTYNLDFSVLTDRGPIDPAFFYEEIKSNVVEGEAAVDNFLTLADSSDPVIDPALTEDQVIELSETNIFPWTSINDAKELLGIEADAWAIIRDNQKKLFEAQLYVKTGNYTGGGSPKYFEFDDNERKNLFMLEAVTEFYLNFDEPWDATKSPSPVDWDEPILSGTAASVSGHRITFSPPIDVSKLRPNHHWIYLKQDSARANKTYRLMVIDGSGNYADLDAEPILDGGASTSDWEIEVRVKVDLLDPEGYTATGVSGGGEDSGSAVVSLDSGISLRGLQAGYDVIYFEEADTSLRASKTYLITDFDDDTNEVTIEGDLYFSGTSAWKITTVPKMVLIDPFGSRFRGEGATSPSSSVLDLPDKTTYDLTSVNNKMDYVYIEEESTSPRKTFRIESRTDPDNELTVLGAINLGSSPSNWELPAGVGGRLDSVKAVKAKSYGYDNYDGMMFVVHQGEIIATYPWTSYTSRENGTTDQATSSKGNRRYDLISYRSSNKFINYSFKIQDPFTNLDGTVEALYYFKDPVTEDTKGGPGGYGWGTKGKKTIRLHHGVSGGSNGSGSDGCMVSPVYYSLRQTMVNRYQEIHKLLDEGGKIDTSIQILSTIKHTAASNASDASPPDPSSADWDNKLKSFLYLIRPDELAH